MKLLLNLEGPWYVHFASCFHVDIYRFMDCYYTLWYHTYAFSLLFCKVYLKRENTGSWNSGLEKEQVWVLYSAQLQMPWKSTWTFFGFYKKYWAKEVSEGSNQGPTSLVAAAYPPGRDNRACGALVGPLPWTSSLPIFSRSGKIHFGDFIPFGLRSKIRSEKCQKHRKTGTGTWHWVNKLVPKNI